MTSFLYDGNRINDEDTPASLDMEDNGAFSSCLFSCASHSDLHSTDTIDVMVERMYHLASCFLPSLILGLILSRGRRVPAALTPPTPTVHRLLLSILPSTHTSVPPANRRFAAAHSLC